MYCIPGLNLQQELELAFNTTGIPPYHRLQQLAGNMSSFLLNSKKHNRNKVYFPGFNRWMTFIIYHGFRDLSADHIHVALYIIHLIDAHCSSSVINC